MNVILPLLNMAEVRQRLGRSVYDLALKINNRSCLEILRSQGSTTTRTSFLLPGYLLDSIQNGGLSGAETAAERVTVGVSLGGYTRFTAVFGQFEPLPNEEDNPPFGPAIYYVSNKIRWQRTQRNVPHLRGNAMLKRTFSTLRTPPQQLQRLFCRHGDFVFVRAYSGNGARSEPLYRTQTGYYEILGVSPSATQAQIKTAYYKQSFIYHPDRNAGRDEATVRFSEISEAYTVLGNKALRRKYDRGLLSQGDLTATSRPSSTRDTSGTSTKRQGGGRQSVMGADRQGGVYDFDKFFKEHYGEQLQRQRYIKLRKEEMLKKKQETLAERKMNAVSEGVIVAMLVMAVGLFISLR